MNKGKSNKTQIAKVSKQVSDRSTSEVRSPVAN